MELEPPLQPFTNEDLELEEKYKFCEVMNLFWRKIQNNFTDVRVENPNDAAVFDQISLQNMKKRKREHIMGGSWISNMVSYLYMVPSKF